MATTRTRRAVGPATSSSRSGVPTSGELGERIQRAATSAASDHATPFYLTDLAALDAAAEAVERAFPDPWIRSYSLKADPLPTVVRHLLTRGWGANCVSLGEIDAARAAGARNEQITLEGIGKGPDEFDAAIVASAAGEPLRWVALESADEARALAARAHGAGLKASQPIRVLLRSNPAIEPGTHDGLAVGRESSKFGMDTTELLEAAKVVAASSGALQLIGIHLHAGSQLHDMVAWQTAVSRSLSAYGALVTANLIDAATHAERGVLCVGGGFPVALDGTDDAAAQALTFRNAADAAWRSADGAVPLLRAIEPGRAAVAAATLLIARVLHVRTRRETVSGPLSLDGVGESECGRQVILDAGMGELIRPALYGARHPVTALQKSGGAVLSAVHGPICESTDALGAHLLPGDLARGDLVAIAGAGAYADAMWSPYNGRPRPARLTVNEDGEIELLRRRGER